MCGLTLVPTVLYPQINETKNQCRGPDATTIKHLPDIGYTAVHHTLFVTGEPTPQPILTEDAVLLFNGEIYNYKELAPDAKSDGEGILAAFRKHGVTFAQYLDGEFAIVLVDLKKKRIIVATDPFGTKPLSVALTEKGGVCLSSYASVIKAVSRPERYMPNTITSYDLTTGTKQVVTRTHVFDLRQYKTTFDDWIAAFEAAVAKRSRGHRVYLGMSSGYDSGAICAVLNKLDADYATYTSRFNENVEVIDARLAINTAAVANDIDESIDSIDRNWIHIQTYSESLTTSKPNTLLAIAEMHRHAREEDGRIVCLSGQGADEIISDYTINGDCIFGDNSKFRGVFPDDLRKLLPTQDPTKRVPWDTFYHSVQHTYLMKEEYIGGAYGVETRYPFLDTNVVQEYLWLTATLKNSAYKAPIRALLEHRNYPYEPNKKHGFNFVTKTQLKKQ